ncbi:PAS domain-containing protein [Methylorubrum extorquens]|uniref:PAS sensor protein n=1 Tax=Methylorubrum extorquens (strain CM4 / NCIMB 13688) TaxID=440085 RepID=B7KRN2_METC4|nr:PAS domain-containing protein [Methylorubrum extorquens]ACK84188.1 PAS sensor protein [Methylorubrum extorquens CM4]ACK85559.1 PAS sensor protein [Methylorubrum extorquens CM4]
MTIVELVKMLAEPLDVAVLLTDIDLERPGPTILYANPAFARMSGYAISQVLGGSPRLLQGSGTSREATRMVARSLRTDGRFRGVLQNYRPSGEAYLCEIDVRAILDRAGSPQAFIAFEREVVRRRGRPSQNTAGRYRPLTQTSLDCATLLSVATALFA